MPTLWLDFLDSHDRWWNFKHLFILVYSGETIPKLMSIFLFHLWVTMKTPTRKLAYPTYPRHFWVDDVPFPKVGYVFSFPRGYPPTSKFYVIWSNFIATSRTDLGPQNVAFRKGHPLLFQGNLGWWNIMNHLARCHGWLFLETRSDGSVSQSSPGPNCWFSNKKHTFEAETTSRSKQDMSQTQVTIII